MALYDNSKLTDFKISLGKVLDDSELVSSTDNTDTIETYTRRMLDEAVLYTDPQFNYCSKYQALTPVSQSVGLPSDYFYHDRTKDLSCTQNAVVNRPLMFAKDRAEFQKATVLYEESYYTIEGKTIVVNRGDITVINFPFHRRALMLIASANTSDFHPKIYDSGVHYVAALFMSIEATTEEEKVRATKHMNIFYNGIGAPTPDKLAEAALG